ncbi:MAG TPA: sensor histidine kinase, partial [Terriglobales bacterium]
EGRGNSVVSPPGLTKRLDPGTRTDMRAPSSMEVRPLAVAFTPLSTAQRASFRKLAEDWWTTFAVKRTKSATKRTSDPVEMRDGRGRALHSFCHDMTGFRPCCPRADGTYISTDNRISLASGETPSKAALFRVRLLYLGGWLGFGFFVWMLRSAEVGRVPAALGAVIWLSGGVALTLGLREVFRRSRLAGWSFTSLVILAVTSSILAAPLWYLVAHTLVRASLAGMQALGLSGMFAREIIDVTSESRWWIPLGNWMTYTSVLLAWSSLYLGINAMLDLESAHARSAHALKLADSARLRALQSQLNPHFLFNALNGIATLIREGQRTRAADTVDTLSDFLRLTLRKLDSPEIPVHEELEFVEQYLRIQRLRFGSSLRATVDADPETHDALVPTLILQPLVENAVRHGVLARALGGVLSVSIRRRDDLLVITVEDDGPGLKDQGALPFGVGFKNSAERVAALYGDDAHMSVGGRPDGRGFVVVVFLPFRKPPGMAADPPRVAIAV